MSPSATRASRVAGGVRRPSGSGLRLVGAVACMVLAGACSSSPTEVVPVPVEVLIAGGDSQYGTTGQTLPTALHVVVQSLSTELPARGRNVTWSVEAGDASITGSALVVTDSTGSARATVRLGTTTGEVTVRATVEGEGGPSVDFRLYVVDRPVLDPLPVTSAAPGSSLTLTGQNFSPDATQNVVLFSGIRGEVTAASTTSLTVTVPACLPERSVAVRAQLGALASTSRSLAIEAGGEVTSLGVGEVVDAADAEGITCYTVPGDGTAEYVVVAQAASSVGAATHPVTLFGLGSAGPVAARFEPDLQAARQALPGVSAAREEGWWRARFVDAVRPEDDPQLLWDQRMRALERDLTAERRPGSEPGGSAPRATSSPAAVPSVGERRTFQVYRNPGDFVQVTAVAQYVGARAAFFVDEAAPAGGYTQQDLQYFSDQFDDAIHPTVNEAFGSESDLDGNERIIILLTPSVNALTPRGSGGFIAGFFFGLDLLPDQEGSNAAEVFYSVVPDPSGLYSDPRPKDVLLDVVPAVLGHEFQHMVNFNERVLGLGAEGNEAVWLSEALAQYAEELVARVYEERGDADGTERYRSGVRSRTRRYLSGPDTVSLIVSYGQGTLSERGAGFLFAMYLADRFGEDIVGRLTRTTRTGVANVEAETGTNWAPLLSDWWAASWLDGLGIATGALVYPTVDLRAFLGDPFPLNPDDAGGGDFTRSLSLRSSSAAYYIVRPAAGESTTLRLGGEGGGSSTVQAEARMRIMRVR
ncbi:MAG: hypothetical protein AMS19_09460 [Gemmatimonas sp. SG8_23]|nr:MAG: hypothetical protein AMS19_09460 [Gemmatimonas sp. SG8_23]